MGYTPRTIEKVAQIAVRLEEMGRDERSIDGWVAGNRAYLTMRIQGAATESGWRKLMGIGVELGILERRETNPPHIDQRTVYWRVTEQGRKHIREDTVTAPATTLTQNPGQTTLEN